MADVRVDEHGVVHGVYKLLHNWWNQWCFERHEDGVVRDAQVTEGVPTCLRCVEAERTFGRQWRGTK